MVEIWKPIKGYEGLYEVSNLGRIRNPRKNNKIMKLHDTGRYFQICLCKEGKAKHLLVHRIVAESFIANPKELPQVNHKDENTRNNYIDNLEWVTGYQNLIYGNRIKRIACSNSKPVKAFNDFGELVAEYNSLKDAATSNNLSSINISRCCRGIYSHSGGYIWRFA